MTVTAATPTPSVAYETLVDQINEADRLYFDAPDEVSDARLSDQEYDAKYAMLVDLERHRTPAPNSPTQRVQGTATLAPTRHSTPMLSLAKITEDPKNPDEKWTELAAWVSKTGVDTQFSVEPKLDGASLSLEYEDGLLVSAITRGDGTTGDDVTPNALNMRGVPRRLPVDFSGWVRGEVVIHLDDFDAINVPNAKGEDTFANPRNAAAGAVRHSDPREARRRRLTFYPYDSSDGLMHLEASFLSYQTERARNTTQVGPVTDLTMAVGRMLDLRARNEFPFETDGIVVKVVAADERARLGATGKSPNWAVAVKTVGQSVQTVVRNILWRTGPGGLVAPRVQFEPARCGGTKITFASAHNQNWMRERGIKVGALVEIRRMGDTIPGVERVVDAHPSLPDFEAPLSCSSCDTALIVDGNSNQLRCPNPMNCQPQQAGRLVKWAGRDAADIDGLGPSLIEKLVAGHKLVDAADLYRLTVEDIADVDLVGKDGTSRKVGVKTATKLVANIEGSKGLGLRRALIGLSIPDCAEGTAKRLTAVYSKMEVVESAPTDELGLIKDIGPETAASIHTFFALQPHLVDDLREQGVNLDRLPEDEPVDTTNGHTFVVTGSVPGYDSRKVFETLMERKGWTKQSGVSAKTEYLVMEDKDSTSSKAKKARDLGVTIITPAEAAELAGLDAA